jgi:hypothetical protein
MHVEERVSYLEGKMEEVGKSLARLESAVSGLDLKMDRRFDALEDRSERRFLWLLGAQLTTLIAIIAGMFGVIAKLL